MSNYVNQLSLVAAAPMSTDQQGKKGNGTWFEALAQAWGQALDNKANDIQAQSDAINTGSDTPSAITQLTAQSLEMSFLANSSHSSISSVGGALETMARKQ